MRNHAKITRCQVQIPVPAQQRIRRDDACDARQRLPTEGLGTNSQPTPLRVGQPEASTKLLAQNPVLWFSSTKYSSNCCWPRLTHL
jgi:hypothetical protein